MIYPGQSLIRRILARGIQRGEFRSMDLDYGIYTVVAPMIFLMLSKHSMGVCVRNDLEMDPKQYIATQVNTILYGLSIAPGDSGRGREQTSS